MVDQPRTPLKDDLTYESYLKIKELTSLQSPCSTPPHHDEMLFIIIHQAYELWFKLMLHELQVAREQMVEGNELRARHFVNRVVEISKVLVHQIHILETMNPAEFLGFRDLLNPASGFQSVQFREVEFLAGLKEKRYLGFFKNQPELVKRLQKRLEEPSLRDSFYQLLQLKGFEIPDLEKLDESGELPEVEKEALLLQLAKIYEKTSEHLPLYLLCESLIEFDQYLALWREHHVRVVERVIGFKRGTGGSSGVQYLKTTTSKKCFPLLWEVRTVLKIQQ